MSALSYISLHNISKIIVRSSNHGVGETYCGAEFREIVFHNTKGERFTLVAYGNEDELVTVEVQ